MGEGERGSEMGGRGRKVGRGSVRERVVGGGGRERVVGGRGREVGRGSVRERVVGGGGREVGGRG